MTMVLACSVSSTRSRTSFILSFLFCLFSPYIRAWKSRFSSPVSLMSRLGSWKTIPMLLLTSSFWVSMLYPHTSAVPEVGLISVDSIFRVVVLPAPFGPSIPNSSPFSISMLSWSTAMRSLNFLVRSCVCIAYISVGRLLIVL